MCQQLPAISQPIKSINQPTNQPTEQQGVYDLPKFCWVAKHTLVTIIMKPTNSPTQGQPNPSEKLPQKWHLGHFFPQQIFFRGLGLILYRKQITRNLTQSNSPQTTYYLGSDLSGVCRLLSPRTVHEPLLLVPRLA